MRHAKAHLDPEEELRQRLAAASSEKSVERLREDLRKHLSRKPHPDLPPGAGAFDSGHTDTAERAEEILRETGFGQDRD
jgi:hypothetical protein